MRLRNYVLVKKKNIEISISLQYTEMRARLYATFYHEIYVSYVLYDVFLMLNVLYRFHIKTNIVQVTISSNNINVSKAIYNNCIVFIKMTTTL